MINDLSDFNNLNHRISSACATFQKGIYHLYFLVLHDSQDWYSRILRAYQCLFQLCVTQLLLDSDYRLDTKNIQKRLLKLCKNPDQPLRSEIDPAATITHSVFETHKWKGLHKAHPLYSCSVNALSLYHKTVEARHNLIYRPFMLENYWEDCTLIKLLGFVPTDQEVEAAYKYFISSMLDWAILEQSEMPQRAEALIKELRGEPHKIIKPVCAGNFIYDLFKPYYDNLGKRPTESLLLTYARMLNPKDEKLLQSLVNYRNNLIDSKNLAMRVHLQEDWRTNEFGLG